VERSSDIVLWDPLTGEIVSATPTNPNVCGIDGSLALTFSHVPNGTYTITHDAWTFTNVVVNNNAATISIPANNYTNLRITTHGTCESSGWVDAIFDTTPPSLPTMNAMDTYTAWTTNTVTSSIAIDAWVKCVEYQFCRNTTNSTTDCIAGEWTSNPEHTFTWLADGQIYYYFVRARDSLNNTTGWSSSVSSTQDASAPVWASMIAEPEFTAWTTNTVASTVATDAWVWGVEYQFCINTTNSTSGCTASPWLSDPEYTFTNLDDAQSYFYVVRARDALGNISEWSWSVFSTQDNAAPVWASMIAEPEFTPWTTNTVASTIATDAWVWWVEYQFCINTTNSTVWCTQTDWTETPEWTFTGLVDGQTYYYFVRAQDSFENRSEWSSSVSSTQDSAAPVWASMIAEPEFTPWTTNTVASTPAVDAWVWGVEYQFCINTVDTTTWCTPSWWLSDPEHTFENLDDGVTYFYVVQARDTLGNISEWSSSVSSTQDNAAPVWASMLAMPLFTPWITSTVASTPAVDAWVWEEEYQFCINISNTTIWCTETEWLSVPSYTFEWIINSQGTFIPLEDGQIYFYFVRARDAFDNRSPWSSSVSSTQDASAPVWASMIAEPEFTPGTTNTVASTVATDAWVWGVEYRFCMNTTNSTSECTASPWLSDPEYTFENLDDGVMYFYFVQARDAFDNRSPWSSSVFSTQDNAAPVWASMIAEPEFTPWTTNTVASTPAVDAWVWGVEYRFCMNTTNSTTGCTPSWWLSDPEHTFIGLADGQTYYYFVQTRDAFNNISSWSSSVVSTQDDTPPVTTIAQNWTQCFAWSLPMSLSCTDWLWSWCAEIQYTIINSWEVCPLSWLTVYTWPFNIPASWNKRVCYFAVDNVWNIESMNTSQIFSSATAVWYRDADGDWYGDPNDSVLACEQPDWYVSNNLDCDDTNPAINPSAQEICNMVDMNCNGDPFDITQVPRQECEALIDLYTATDWDNWTNNAWWLEDADIDNWFGIQLWTYWWQQYVTHIILWNHESESYFLTTADDLWNNLQWTLPESLGNFVELRALNIKWNQTSPTWNQLSWTIPSSLWNLQQLQHLLLWNHTLTGDVPSSFQNLTNLTALHLHGNNLSWDIDQWIWTWNQISIIYWRSNNFTWVIPETLSWSTILTRFRMQNNNIWWTIPSYFWDTVTPSRLNLANNQLVWSLPDSFIWFTSFVSNSNRSIAWNALNRTNTHHVILTPAQQTWLDWLNNPLLINNQSDITPPIIQHLSNGLFTVQNTIPVTIEIDENSYAIAWTLSEAGVPAWWWMPVTIDGPWFCSSLTASSVMTNQWETTITISWSTYWAYEDCTLTVTDHGNNQSNTITLDTFYFYETVFEVCYHPLINISVSECLALAELYQQTDGDNWTNKSWWFASLDVADWYGVTALQQWPLKTVTWLALANNNLVGMIPADLADLTNAVSMTFANNALTAIEDWFAQNPGLLTLNLAHNQFSALPTDLGWLSWLIELRVNNNNLQSIDPSVWWLTALQYLNISNNPGIEQLPDEIWWMIALQVFLANSIELQAIPESIQQLINLQVLSMFNNRLQDIPDDLWTLQDLVSLNLSYNSIWSVPASLSSLLSLEQLDLSFNALTTLNDILWWLEQLQSLQLRDNLIETIDASVNMLQALTYLDISNNRLVVLPDEIGTLPALEELRVTNNLLTELPADLSWLISLEKLYASQNLLTALPLQMSGLTTLTEVRLASNRITSPTREPIPASFWSILQWPNDILRLENNRLPRNLWSWPQWNRAKVDPSLDAWAAKSWFVLWPQTDLTASILSWTGTVPLLSPSFFYEITVDEESFMVNANGAWLPIVFGWWANCSMVQATVQETWRNDIIENGTFTLIISSSVDDNFENCTLRVRDHWNNLSNALDLGSFQLSNTIDTFCSHPMLSIPKSECDVLYELYTQTNGQAGWRANSANWFVSLNVNDWFGVRTESLPWSSLDHVTWLFLHRPSWPNAHGQSSTWIWNNIVWPLPISLWNLPYLRDLNLSNNAFNGSIPPSIWWLTVLETRWMRSNNLTWAIPATIGDMTNLGTFWFENNALSGELPVEFFDLQNLIIFNIENNNIWWVIEPVWTSRWDFVWLNYINVANNTFDWLLPASLGSLWWTLTRIYLNGNNFVGSVPSTYETWLPASAILAFNISHNNLNRTNQFNAILTPAQQIWFQQIPGVTWRSNQWDITPPVIDAPTQIIGEWASSWLWIVDGPFTYDLQVTENSFTITQWDPWLWMPVIFWWSALCQSLQATRVTWWDGSVQPITITPTQPWVYENCTIAVRDHGNNLSNTLVLPPFGYDLWPAQICYNNALTIPVIECLSLASLYLMTWWDSWANNNNWFDEWVLDVNQWFGINTTTVWWQEYVHQILLHRSDFTTTNRNIVSWNNVQGTLPDIFGAFAHLQTVYLDGNSLVWSVPVSIWSHPTLEAVSLADNSLNWAIGWSFVWTSLLRYLNLSGNTIAWTIPQTFMQDSHWLEFLLMANNQLEGTLTLPMSTLTQLQELDLSGNQLTWVLPAALNTLTNLVWLNLSNNQFTGWVPNLAQLNSLIALNLANNQLAWTLPVWWAFMSNLQTLDVSGNTLTWNPLSIVWTMPSLTSANLADNRFIWRVGGQFTASSVESLDISWNNFDRDVTHQAIITAWQESRFQAPAMYFYDWSNQWDTTAPIVTSNDLIISPVSAAFMYTFTVQENSYAVNALWQWMKIDIIWPWTCTDIAYDIQYVMESNTSVTLTLYPIDRDVFTCQITVTDHAWNVWVHTMPTFWFDSLCGNGLLDQGEECDEWRQCDDGTDCTNDASICPGQCRPRFIDWCNPSCQFSFCGDGYVDELWPDQTPWTFDDEFCDPGRVCQITWKDCTYNPGACTAVDWPCVVTWNSECSQYCAFAWCGDGTLDLAAWEECDDGPLNGTSQSTCSVMCQHMRCGDWIVWSHLWQQCDLGPSNGAPWSPCDTACQLIVDEACWEVCADTGQWDDKYSIILIADRSWSMNWWNKLENLKVAATWFVDTVIGRTFENGQWVHGSQVWLITINHQAPIFNIHPTDDFAAVNAAINNITAEWNLDIASWINTARTRFANNLWDENAVIVLLTDGNPTHPWWSNDARQAAINAATAAKNEWIEIFTVWLQVNESWRSLLQTISSWPNYHYEDQSNQILSEIYKSVYWAIHCACEPFEQIEVMCGNGNVDPWEECDPWRFCSGDWDPDTLTGTSCADWWQDECDALWLGTCRTYHIGTCTEQCRLPFCGDWVVNPAAWEQCDDGNNVSGDWCSSTCQIEFCGDGTVQYSLWEQCDEWDLNGTEWSLCNSECQLIGCWDGTVQPELGEECDTGKWCDDRDPVTQTWTECTNDASLCPGQCRTRYKEGCTPSCRLWFCGDGFVDPTLGEECDPWSYCVEWSIVNGINFSWVNCTNNPNICWDPALCQPTDQNFCSATCQLPFCGDGFVTSELVTISFYQCFGWWFCGDGIVDPDGIDNIPWTADDEQCDDGMHCADLTQCTTDAQCTWIWDGLCRPRSGTWCSEFCKIEPITYWGPWMTENHCNNGIFEPELWETWLDCGGPCQACPTCDDYLLNPAEYWLDC
jgi:cysteine-rich repeat protein